MSEDILVFLEKMKEDESKGLILCALSDSVFHTEPYKKIHSESNLFFIFLYTKFFGKYICFHTTAELRIMLTYKKHKLNLYICIYAYMYNSTVIYTG